jgi:ubiquitin-conjugating enzyme E2 Q
LWSSCIKYQSDQDETQFFQETYPSTPPVWFAESEEFSVTNAVQTLSNTIGSDNHVINQVIGNLLSFVFPIISKTKMFNDNSQVDILVRELCRLHNVPLPPDIDKLKLTFQLAIGPASIQMQNAQRQQQQMVDDIESDADDIDDAVGESEQESEGEEDLPLEMDEGRNANKVCWLFFFLFLLFLLWLSLLLEG